MNLEAEINAAWEAKSSLDPHELKTQFGRAIEAAIDALENG